MRLIDAEALKKTFCENCMLNTEIAVCSEKGAKNCAVQKMIDYAPTIEAEAVRHEKWEPYIGPFSAPVFRCSACGSQTAHFNRHPYCFGCGAKMDGDLR